MQKNPEDKPFANVRDCKRLCTCTLQHTDWLNHHYRGPLLIESLWAMKRVSTGALGALDDLHVVETNT